MAKRYNVNIDPDEIFMDSRNLPSFDDNQFEGRIEKPISKVTLTLAGLFFLMVGLIFLWRVGSLQVVHGAEYANRSKNNTLRFTDIIPDRGLVYDRNGAELIWNAPARTYIDQPGFAHLLGYIGLPTESDLASGKYEPDELIGQDGIEAYFNDELAGQKGIKIEEIDVNGDVKSDHNIHEAKSGKALTLSVDAKLQAKLYDLISTVVRERGFSGGAGVMMDVKTGEIIALTSYPEYNSNIMTARTDKTTIQSYMTNSLKPFLNRVVSGVYSPGSIFKTIMSIGALTEGVITPEKQILSTGQIEVPNPYNPKEKSIFKDNKAHGWVDIRHALAVSSNVYFYEVGGGYQGQKGIGIRNIDRYAKMFGLSSTTGIEMYGEAAGTIPSPEWKAAHFKGEQWMLGDTYHTSIGQYGVQVTPLQMVRVAAAMSNNGKLLTPTLLKNDQASSTIKFTQLNVPEANFQVVREGMRLAVTEGGVKGLNTTAVDVAAKTGTAQLGVEKVNVNSWVIGFFPYEHPRYAFAVVMENGNGNNQIGGVFVMRTLFDWMGQNLPDYFK